MHLKLCHVWRVYTHLECNAATDSYDSVAAGCEGVNWKMYSVCFLWIHWDLPLLTPQHDTITHTHTAALKSSYEPVPCEIILFLTKHEQRQTNTLMRPA